MNKIMSLTLRVIVFLMAVAFLIPVILTVLKSLIHDESLSLSQYNQLLFNCFPFYSMFWNSVIYSTLITGGLLIISIPAAFAFKFADFRGKKVLYVIYIIIMMMPLQVLLLPNYIGLRVIGILNSRMAILLPMIFSPFGVVVIHQYMREIDISLIEAARLETNSVLKIISHCVIPQIKVCITAVALFVYTDMWNMVEQPMIYVDSDKLRTLSALIAQADHYEEGIMLPASVLFLIPILLCYLLFHEELKNGLKID